MKKENTGKLVIISWFITYSVYAIMLLITIPKTTEYANGIDLLDMKPLGYNFDYVQMLFTSLNSEGRTFYLHYQLPIDFIYPSLFTLCGMFTFTYFIKKINLTQKFWNWIVYIPLIAGVFDYLENIGIIWLLNSYPSITPKSVELTSYCSMIKSSATTIYFLLLLFLIVTAIMKQMNKGKMPA